MTPLAIRREIRTLEEHLGRPLFHRIDRALQLTLAGGELYRAADKALALIESTIERLAALNQNLLRNSMAS